ncbi:MAG: iron export ABC transporter permease subunit FetB [Acidiferrobacterales bacterium]
MSVITLTPLDLGLAAVLVIVLAVLSLPTGLDISKQLIVAALRTVVQLLFIGFVLKALFENANLGWVTLIAFIMLAVAGREVMVRQKRRLRGWWGFSIGSASMFISTFGITILVLILIIGTQPWYKPQYAIPLLGMVLGNTMTGVALALDRLTQSAWQHHTVIEARLMLGQTWQQAIGDIRLESVRSGMIPIINAMAVAGLVSLPGMMTGQILAGTPPLEAVKYQILIMFMIGSGTGFGTLAAVWIASRRLFDARERLRLDRIKGAG